GNEKNWSDCARTSCQGTYQRTRTDATLYQKLMNPLPRSLPRMYNFEVEGSSKARLNNMKPNICTQHTSITFQTICCKPEQGLAPASPVHHFSQEPPHEQTGE
ncbi:unnamed protein product, partial [Choristocarpus tenellus]